MAAAELGVRGRRRERDVTEENESTMWKTPEPPTAKRRKIQEVDVRESTMNFSLQIKNRGGIAVRDLVTGASETETSVVFFRRSDLASIDDQCSSDDDELDCESISCCSSNEFVEKSKRRLEFVDLKEGNEADEIGTSRIDDWRSDQCFKQQDESVNMENQTSEPVESDRRSKLQKSRRVTVNETEVEDFFKETEKNLRRKVLESSIKYNFDFEKDEPVGEGRYEWVKLKP